MKRILTPLTFLLAAASLLAAAPDAQAQERKIVVEGFRADDSNMSIQLNLTGMILGDDSLDEDRVADLGGGSLSWRWDIIDWGGLEVALGAYGRASDDGAAAESSTTFSVAWMWYFARHHHHRFYAVTGLSSLDTQGTIDRNGNLTDYTYSEFGPVLGLGSEWLISKNWLFSVDARALLLSSQDDANYTSSVEPGDSPQATNAIPYTWITPPESRSAVQFGVGFGYRW